MKKQALKVYTIEKLTNKHIGQRSSPQRETLENELWLDLLGNAIREARRARHLTQKKLGQLVGVQSFECQGAF